MFCNNGGAESVAGERGCVLIGEKQWQERVAEKVGKF